MEALDNLIVIRNQASELIRAEVRAGQERRLLERAVIGAINQLGHSIDEVSEASGLTPTEIEQILDRPADLEELNELTGV